MVAAFATGQILGPLVMLVVSRMTGASGIEPTLMPALHAVFVPRKGEINAWDNAVFQKTVRETGKNTLIIDVAHRRLR